jgi:hypothetical protein
LKKKHWSFISQVLLLQGHVVHLWYGEGFGREHRRTSDMKLPVEKERKEGAELRDNDIPTECEIIFCFFKPRGGGNVSQRSQREYLTEGLVVSKKNTPK